MDRIVDREGFRKSVVAAAEHAAEWLWEHAVEGMDVRVLEQEWRETGGDWLRVALGLALSGRGALSRCGRVHTCSCGAEATFKQHRPYRIETVLPGKAVSLRAAYYVCGECHRGCVPVLEDLGVGGDGMTRALRELVVLAGTVEPYESASATLLAKMAGVTVSDVQVQRAACSEAGRIESYLEQQAACGHEKRSPVGQIVVGIDGGMVHVDGRWQEAKLACLYEPQHRIEVSAKRRALLRREVTAVLGDPSALRAKLWSRLKALAATEATAIVLRDGAPWISNLAEELFASRIEILDWYHVVEHVHECARVLYGKNADGSLTDKAEQWSEAQLNRLWEGRVDDVLSTFRFLRGRQHSAAKQKALDLLTRFFDQNRRAMNYPRYREQGWPCGSGHVESAIAHVIQQRMKRTGCRWERPGAAAMLTLRCVYRSHGRWDEYWAQAA